MAEIEKAKGNPRREVFLFLKSEKKSIKKLLKELGNFNSQTKEKAKMIFRKTAQKVIKVGVLVS